MSTVRILVLGMLVMTACAEPPTASADPTGTLPDVAELICEPDGGTRVVTPEAQVQPDGIHVHVRVFLDEPVVLDGLWLERRVGPGEADIVTLNPPGLIGVACWPVSQLESESFEPERAELEILDPEGIYVSEELECMPGDDTAGWSMDWEPPGPDRDPPVTPAEARSVLERLEPGDVLAYAGYPERPGDRIAVERDGRTIAIMWFYRDGDTVDSDDGGICEGEAVFPSRMLEEREDR